MGLLFEWDENKAKENQRKHRDSFEEATTIFADTLARTIFDPLHSENEDRFVSIGESRDRRLLVVVFTDENASIRIITARKANRRERVEYEESKGKP